MLELIGTSLNALAGIALVVLGIRNVDPNGVRTKCGQQMIFLGVVVVAAALMIGLPEFVEGFKAGAAD